MLHICTPAFRYDHLEKIYDSIPKSIDITWHIAKIRNRPPISFEFIADKRVKIYEIDCDDKDTVTKRNTIFDHVKEGYFILLDDDTIFLLDAYHVYNRYNQKNFIGMIIGNMYTFDGRKFLKDIVKLDTNLLNTSLDTGMVICHYSVLDHVRWAWVKEVEPNSSNDYYFWTRCYTYFGKGNTEFVEDVIARYNFFAPLIRVRRKLFFIKLNFDIHNYYLAKFYNFVLKVGSKLRPIFGIKKNPQNKFPYFC